MQRPGEKGFQAEGTASAKVLRLEHAWQVEGHRLGQCVRKVVRWE